MNLSKNKNNETKMKTDSKLKLKKRICLMCGKPITYEGGPDVCSDCLHKIFKKMERKN